jgi:DNA-binding NtrC family response regulator
MKKRILIVDSEIDVVAEPRGFAADHNATIDIAETADEAVTLMNMREYELVIVGLKPAESTGHKEKELLKNIKENKGTTGIILLSGCGGTKATEEAFSIGASYFHEKRLSTKVLQDAMKKFGGY